MSYYQRNNFEFFFDFFDFIRNDYPTFAVDYYKSIYDLNFVILVYAHPMLSFKLLLLMITILALVLSYSFFYTLHFIFFSMLFCDKVISVSAL